jgi:dihydroorotate dehydrogenase (fumarate)/dihydroorotate dehydrogenase
MFWPDPKARTGWPFRSAEILGRAGTLCSVLAERHAPASDRLAIDVAGLAVRTPLGLAAGFDKSARAVRFMATLGFGHLEVGSISAEPSGGNPRPRLFRIPADRGIVVNYGLPNDGAELVARRLDGLRLPVPLGVNVVSTNHGATRRRSPTTRSSATTCARCAACSRRRTICA